MAHDLESPENKMVDEEPSDQDSSVGDVMEASELELDINKKNDDIPQEDLVRIMIQALHSMKFENAAKQLEKESQMSLYSRNIEEFREKIILGKWEEVHQNLNVLHMVDTTHEKMVKLLLYTQEYLEILEAGKQKKAIHLLQSKISKVVHNRETMQSLTCLLMCMTPEDLRYRANWDGTGKASRMKLLTNIENHVSPKLLIPKNRLVKLLQMGLYHERQQEVLMPEWKLTNDGAENTYSIFTRPVRVQDSIPKKLKQQILTHKDEIWHLNFSPNGEKLVTGAKDGAIHIHELNEETGNFEEQKKCLYHEKPIHALSFSPNGNMLAISTKQGVSLLDLSLDRDPISIYSTMRPGHLHWLTNDNLIICHGSTLVVYQVSTDQIVNRREFPDLRVVTFQCNEDKMIIGGIIEQHELKVYSTKMVLKPQLAPNNTVEQARTLKRALLYSHKSDSHIMSTRLSPCGEYLLASYSRIDKFNGQGMIKCFRVTDHGLEPIGTYDGYNQLRYDVGIAFGGYGSHLVICGSENGHIYVWNRMDGKLLFTVEAHHSCINDIVWHPSHRLMASVSDDLRVNIYEIDPNMAESS